MSQPQASNTDFIKEISALTNAAGAVREVQDATLLVLPRDYQHHDITDLVEKAGLTPNRKRGLVQLGSIESFLTYVGAHAHTAHSTIYADPDMRKLVAVLNDHSQGDVNQPGWRDFRAEFTAELSREFHTWWNENKKAMSQEEFAIFLEDNIADIAAPSGDDLLAMALTLQAKTEATFSSAKRLDNGQVQLQYSESIETRVGQGQIEVPREITLGLRIFKNGDGYKVRARLKYRLGNGNVKFWYEMDRPQDVIEDAFKAYLSKATEANVAPVLLGKP